MPERFPHLHRLTADRRAWRRWLFAVLGAAITAIAGNWLLALGASIRTVAEVPGDVRSLKSEMQEHVDSTLKYLKLDTYYLCVSTSSNEADKRACGRRAAQQ